MKKFKFLKGKDFSAEQEIRMLKSSYKITKSDSTDIITR